MLERERRSSQPCSPHALTFNVNLTLAVLHDVEEVAFLALLDDILALGII